MTRDRLTFRAWDKGRRRFHFGTSNLMLDLSGLLYWQFGFNGPEVLAPEEREEYVLEQWTGLLDRHGHGIYEGDILITSNDDPAYDLWTPEDYGRTVVVWDETTRTLRGSRWTWERNNADAIYDVRFVSIVGNIHETPELLQPS